MNKYLRDFLYLLEYYSLPKELTAFLGTRGAEFKNGFRIICNVSRSYSYMNCYTIDYAKSLHYDDKLEFSVYEAIHSFCLEL